MLINKLNTINNVLDNLINITEMDINAIKESNHEIIFSNMTTKEELASNFSYLKSEVDSILVARNRPIEEIFTPEEEKLFDEFREKLNQFHTLHKKFSKLALSVANFYNVLMNEIKNEKPLTYKNNNPYSQSTLTLRA